MRFVFEKSKIDKRMLRKAVMCMLSVLLVAALSACGGISDIPDPSSDYYVCDFAEVISAECGEYICTLASALDGVSGAQIVIVTLPDTEGYAIDRYASALFSGWSVGDDEKNNGIMLVMCPSSGEYWMTRGDGLDAALGDGALKTMMAEKLEPCFAAGDYDGGARGIFDAIYEKLCSHYNVSPVPDSYDGGTYNGSAAYEKALDGSATGRAFMILILIAVIVAAFILMLRILLRGVLGIGARRGSGASHASYQTRDAGSAPRNTAQNTPRDLSYNTARNMSQNAVRKSADDIAAKNASAQGAHRTASRISQNDGTRRGAAQTRRGSAAYEVLRQRSERDSDHIGR